MENNKNLKEYAEKLKAIKLSESSRARMEKTLLEYVRFHAVRVGADSRSIGRVPNGTRSIAYIFNIQKKSMIAAFIALMLIVGGGTSYAAEGAVPGDFLYPVKIDVNENVEGALAMSDAADAELQAKLAEERLKEAEILAARGKLTASVANDINARVKAHYENAEKHVAAEEARGDLDASASVRARIEGSFRTHADILSDLNAHVQGNDAGVLIGSVRAFVTTLVDAEAKATATVAASANAHASVEAAVTNAEQVVVAAQNQLAAHKDTLSATAAARADRDIAKAVAFEASAKSSLKENALQEAYVSAQAAVREASKATTIIESSLELHIDGTIKVDTVSTETDDDKAASDVHSESDTKTTGTMHTGSDSSDNTTTTGNVHVETGTHIETPVVNTTIKTGATGAGSLDL